MVTPSAVSVMTTLIFRNRHLKVALVSLGFAFVVFSAMLPIQTITLEPDPSGPSEHSFRIILPWQDQQPTIRRDGFYSCHESRCWGLVPIAWAGGGGPSPLSVEIVSSNTTNAPVISVTSEPTMIIVPHPAGEKNFIPGIEIFANGRVDIRRDDGTHTITNIGSAKVNAFVKKLDQAGIYKLLPRISVRPGYPWPSDADRTKLHLTQGTKRYSISFCDRRDEKHDSPETELVTSSFYEVYKFLGERKYGYWMDSVTADEKKQPHKP